MQTSLFLEPRTSPDPAHHYRTVVQTAVLAEELGYDKLWVSVTHFRSLGFSISGPFPILAAIGEHTHRIRLGPAVVPLVFENPIRVAEDASLLDHLSGGRVELGLGKGNTGRIADGATLSTSSHIGFKIDTGNIDQVYRQNLDALLDILDPTRRDVESLTAKIYPLSERLAARIWRASATEAEVVRIAQNGDGLLLYRAGRQHSNKQGQADLISLYRGSFKAHLPGQKPRTGLSRSVLPATDRAEAEGFFAQDRIINPQYYRDFEPLREQFAADPEYATFPEDYFAFMGTALGSAAEVAAALAEDPAVQAADELLFNIPLSIENPGYQAAMRSLMHDMVPRLNRLLNRRAA